MAVTGNLTETSSSDKFPSTTGNVVRGPLTTTFTPPLSCSSIYVWTYYPPIRNLGNQPEDIATFFFQGASCYDSVPGPDDNCLPPNATAADTYPATLSLGPAIYSPGIYCPAGYTTACLSARFTNGTQSPIPQGLQFAFFPKVVQAGETAAICCPRCFSSGTQ